MNPRTSLKLGVTVAAVLAVVATAAPASAATPSPTPSRQTTTDKSTPQGKPKPPPVAHVTKAQAEQYAKETSWQKPGRRATRAVQASPRLDGHLSSSIPGGYVSLKVTDKGIEVRVRPGYEGKVPKTFGDGVPVITVAVNGPTKDQQDAELDWWNKLTKKDPKKLAALGVTGFGTDSDTGKLRITLKKNTADAQAKVQTLRPHAPLLFEAGGPVKPANAPPSGSEIWGGQEIHTYIADPSAPGGFGTTPGGCTSGFSLLDENNLDYGTTSGHCFDPDGQYNVATGSKVKISFTGNPDDDVPFGTVIGGHDGDEAANGVDSDFAVFNIDNGVYGGSASVGAGTSGTDERLITGWDSQVPVGTVLCETNTNAHESCDTVVDKTNDTREINNSVDPDLPTHWVYGVMAFHTSSPWVKGGTSGSPMYEPFTGPNNELNGVAVGLMMGGDTEESAPGVLDVEWNLRHGTAIWISEPLAEFPSFRLFASVPDGSGIQPVQLPKQPYDVTVKSVTDGLATLTWKIDDSVYYNTDYKIQFRRTGDSTWLDGPNGSITSWNGTPRTGLNGYVDNLDSDQQYEFRVAAVSYAGQGAWSASASTTVLGDYVVFDDFQRTVSSGLGTTPAPVGQTGYPWTQYWGTGNSNPAPGWKIGDVPNSIYPFDHGAQLRDYAIGDGAMADIDLPLPTGKTSSNYTVEATYRPSSTAAFGGLVGRAISTDHFWMAWASPGGSGSKWTLSRRVNTLWGNQCLNGPTVAVGDIPRMKFVGDQVSFYVNNTWVCSVTDTSLNGSTATRYGFWAQPDTGSTDVPTWDDFTVLTAKAGQPIYPAGTGNVTATPNSASNQVTVNWKAPDPNGSPITGYDVRYGDAAADTWTTASKAATDSAHTFSSVPVGSYDVQVRAKNATGASAWTSTAAKVTIVAVTVLDSDNFNRADTTKGLGTSSSGKVWLDSGHVTINSVAGYTQCATENGTCTLTGTNLLAYGSGSTFFQVQFTGNVACTNSKFGGDPTPGVAKRCYVAPAGTPPADTASISQFKISGNKLQAIYGSGDNYISTIDPGVSNYAVQAVNLTSGATDAAIIGRATDANNHWTIYHGGATGGKYALWKRVGGGWSTFPTSTVTAAAGDVVKLSFSGSTVKMIVNGVQLASVTDTFNQTATRAGFRVGNGTGGATALWDNFVITDF